MNKTYLSSILELIKKSIDVSYSQKNFSDLSIKLSGLLYNLYSLKKSISKIKESIPAGDLTARLEDIEASLVKEAEKLAEIESEVTNYKIAVHVMEKGDTLWKIAKKYDAEIVEIYELNNIKNIFSLDEIPAIFVPVKNNKL